MSQLLEAELIFNCFTYGDMVSKRRQMAGGGGGGRAVRRFILSIPS